MNSSRVLRYLVGLAIGLLGMAVVPSALADSQARIVRLSYTQGSVEVDRGIGQGFEKAIMNMPMIQGMQLQTNADSRAEVEFEDGTTVRLGPDTRLNFTELALRDSGARVTNLEIDDGIAYVNYRRHGDEDFRISFGGQSVALTRSVHFRANVSNSDVELAVFKGDLELAGSAEQVKVKKNEVLTLNLVDQGQYELAKGLPTQELDDWDTQRISYLDQYASNSGYKNLPYYGRSDLSYYGTWISDPYYGNLWRPYYVGSGWDPFWNGAWTWYPGYGYTWVSTYPWGWIPYRYGSWIFAGGYGWAWSPAATWTTWNVVPVVVNAPGNYRVPVPPSPRSLTPNGGPLPTVIVNNTPPNAVAPMRPAPRSLDTGVRGGRAPILSNSVSPAAGSAPAASISPAVVSPSRPSRGPARSPDPGYIAPASPPRSPSFDRGFDRGDGGRPSRSVGPSAPAPSHMPAPSAPAPRSISPSPSPAPASHPSAPASRPSRPNN